MTMLDGMRTVFLEALSFVPAEYRGALVNEWNEQCDEVYKYKNELIAEEHFKANALKNEVAREIFAEIKTALKLYKKYDLKSGTYFECYLEAYIAELEKKYPEEKE